MPRIAKTIPNSHSALETLAPGYVTKATTRIFPSTSFDDMSKVHAEFLEARLIHLTAQVARVTLDNDTQPDTGRRRLPEADAPNMEQFLANLRIIIPVIRLNMLKPQPRAVSQSAKPVAEGNSGDAQFEIRHKSGVQASAVEEDGEFVLLEGSEALTGTGNLQQSYGGPKEN